MNKKFVNGFFTFSLILVIFFAGFRLGEWQTRQKLNLLTSKSNTSQQLKRVNPENLDFSLFWETWATLEKKFIDSSKIDPQSMIYGAIKGMVASLDDPYTFFLTPKENQQSKDDLEGKFEGIGAQLGLKNNRIIVVAPLKNSPAEKAGVRAGDYINKVDNQSTKNWTLPQAVSKIRGPKGTKVTLTLERNNKEFDLTITRAQIIVQSVEFSLEKSLNCQDNCPQVGYLKVNQFGANTNDEWDQEVNRVSKLWKEKSIKGIILDLRDNPGGFLESAVYLASDFLPENSLIVKQESATTYSKKYYSSRTPRLRDVPVVILINQGSASASEILAGSLRDYNRAKIVGEKSFGKGSVQEALDLSQGAGLHVTVAKWVLPKGDWINSKGIEPEIEVKNELEEGNTLTRQADTQLEEAIKILLK